MCVCVRAKKSKQTKCKYDIGKLTTHSLQVLKSQFEPLWTKSLLVSRYCASSCFPGGTSGSVCFFGIKCPRFQRSAVRPPRRAANGGVRVSKDAPRRSCLGVYSHFPWNVVSPSPFMITALSLSIEIIALLLEELNHDRSSSLLFLRPGLVSPLSSDSSQEAKDDSRPAADRLGVGCVAGGREWGRPVKWYRNSWLKRGNGR